MKSLVFDIEGKFAHFRKFYTNSSSLSYSVPPRTTIEGLIGAILGYERDSYYKKLSSDNLYISVKKNRPTRNLTQTLNYIKATSVSQLYAPDEHTQIPFEIITGDMDENVSFRIYVASDEKYMDELQERLILKKFVYPPCLGTVFFQGDIDNVGICEIFTEKSDDYIEINSIVPAEKIKIIKIDDCQDSYQLIKEKMPKDFDENRGIKRAETYIFDQRGRAIELKINCLHYIIKYNNTTEKILFM